MQSEILRFFRNAKHVGQKTVADVLDMSQANYSEIENGKRKITEPVAEKLAAYYGVNREVFLPDSQAIFNHNNGENSKGIVNTEQYYETNKDLLQQILDKAERFINLIGEERKELSSERKQIFELLNKLADSLKK